MITLKTLTQLADGRFYAKWYDADDNYPELGHTVAALHDGSGRPEAVNLGLRVPSLTAEQMQQAQPDQHRAYDLAAQGTAVRPDWANRYQKAAEIVEANGVTLTSDVAAVVVSTSGTTYAIYDKSCTCKFSRLGQGICSHYLATRMARALGQPIGGDEATRERAAETRRQANRDAKERRIASRGENIAERARRAQVGTGEDARRYILATMANGGSIPADKWAQAHSGLVGQGGS